MHNQKKTPQQKALSENLVMVKREKTTEKQRKISRKAELATLLENLVKVEQQTITVHKQISMQFFLYCRRQSLKDDSMVIRMKTAKKPLSLLHCRISMLEVKKQKGSP